MQQSVSSCALGCCECGAVVGTEGPQRGTLLLPCQHVLHVGCAEFIKRRGKLLMGMDSADVVQDEGGMSADGSSSTGSVGVNANGSAIWTRQMHDRCLCPVCLAPIMRIIPLYVRSEDDPVAKASRKARAVELASAPNPCLDTVEEDYKLVHSAQKRVLLRLRGLCEQRRRVTELTRTCANLHEQRAHYLADVEKEERCFPGLISGTEKKDAQAVEVIASSAKGAHGASPPSSSAASSFSIEHMGITELELYMAQATPRLLRTQAEVRKERQMVERRTKKLNALRAHYYSTKELHALNTEIAVRQAQVRGLGGSKRSSVHHHDGNSRSTKFNQSDVAVPSSVSLQLPEAAASSAAPLVQLQQETPVSVVTPSVLPPTPSVPARKKMRGEAAIDVDDEPPAEVVEILSGDASETDEPEVMIIDNDDDAGSDVDAQAEHDGVVERLESSRGCVDNANTLEVPYLIPCYVRTSSTGAATVASESAEPKTSRTVFTRNHVRMLPRREDRLWQSSLQF